jgi:hypothetical protein
MTSTNTDQRRGNPGDGGLRRETGIPHGIGVLAFVLGSVAPAAAGLSASQARTCISATA